MIDAAQAAREPGLDVQLGGQAIEKQPPLSLGTVVGVLAAAIVLFIAFGSLLATLLPLITALAGVARGLMAIAPLTHSMSIVTIAPIIAALIGLGVGIDYALFIVTRYRRGLEAGLTPEEAAVTALNTSGRTVLFAGGTVCIALLGILVLNFGFLNGLAIACTLTVVLTVLATITVLPALFGLLAAGCSAAAAPHAGHAAGPPAGRSRRRQVRGRGGRTSCSGARRCWPRWPSRSCWFSPSPCRGSSSAAPTRATTPLQPPPGRPTTCWPRASGRASTGRWCWSRGQFAGRRGRAPCAGSAPAAPGGRRQRRRGRARVRYDRHPADAAHVTGGTATTALITTLRTTTIPAAEQGTTLRVYVGGQSATIADFTSAVEAKLPWFLLTIIGLSFLLLVIAFRSLLIPATAAVMTCSPPRRRSA